MIINNEDLKYDGQCPRSMHALAILTIFFKQSISLTTALRYFHETLSGPGADKLLYLSIALVNSSFEKEGQVDGGFDGISSKMFILI